MKKRFRVALSFTSSKREFVADMAGILANRLGVDSVLYDAYHVAEFARVKLDTHLARLYQEQTELVVVVLGRDFEKREWCGLQWSEIYARVKSRDHSNVMLMRFDQVEGGLGLFGLAGFVNLDDKTPQEAAALVFDRLALNESQDTSSHSRAVDLPLDEWPAHAPPIDWPMANQDEARRLFATLITRDAPFRLLLVRGAGDTGKSHLTKQFLRNALKIQALRSARFDFKGSFDMDPEMRSFAERLEVPLPESGTGVAPQLAQILSSLKLDARPTILILDTYEMAGEADLWVQRELFAILSRAWWLRLIIVGQRVPAKHGESWEGISSELIELRPPTPQEWFDFGKPHKRGITLEFVRSLHEAVGGKPAILAQLLGPSA